LIISGTIGAGKSQIADEISWLLERRNIRHGLVDLDHLANLNPVPDNDPCNRRLARQNLAEVWRNYLARGATRLVIAWVLESREALAGFQEAIPKAEICVIRLVASTGVVAERLRRREVGRRHSTHHERFSHAASESNITSSSKRGHRPSSLCSRPATHESPCWPPPKNSKASSRDAKGRGHESSHPRTRSTAASSGPPAVASTTTSDPTRSGRSEAASKAVWPPRD
jgi:hypothetical protein